MRSPLSFVCVSISFLIKVLSSAIVFSRNNWWHVVSSCLNLILQSCLWLFVKPSKSVWTWACKKAKSLALSQQVTTGLQWTAWLTRNINNTDDPQKKHRHWTVSNFILLEGLNWFHLPLFRYRSRQIDVWFAWKIQNLSMDHLLVNRNRDIKRR